MLYKFINNLVAVSSGPYQNAQGMSTRCHFMRYLILDCKTSVLKEPFFLTTIVLWNQLPEILKTTPHLGHFQGWHCGCSGVN